MDIKTDIGTRAAIVLAGLASITCLAPATIATSVANGALTDAPPQMMERGARCVQVSLGRREERALTRLAKLHRVSVEAELARIIEEELCE